MSGEVHIGQLHRVWWSYFDRRPAARWKYECSCGYTAEDFWARRLRRVQHHDCKGDRK